MINLIGDYYMKSDKLAYIVGKPRKELVRGAELAEVKYYSTIGSAITSTSERALRDKIAAGEITTLHDAVEELRMIKDEIIAAIGDGEEV